MVDESKVSSALLALPNHHILIASTAKLIMQHILHVRISVMLPSREYHMYTGHCVTAPLYQIGLCKRSLEPVESLAGSLLLAVFSILLTGWLWKFKLTVP